MAYNNINDSKQNPSNSTATVTRISEGGRVVIPSALREELGLKVGDELLIAKSGDKLLLYPRHAAVTEVREAIKRYLPKSGSIVADFINDRKKEAEKE